MDITQASEIIRRDRDGKFRRKAHFNELDATPLKNFTADELEAIKVIAKHQHEEPIALGSDAFKSNSNLPDLIFIGKSLHDGYFLVNTEGYDYCRYIMKLKTSEVESQLLNKYNKMLK